MQDQTAYRRKLALKAAKKWKNLVYRNRLQKQREPDRMLKLFDQEAYALNDDRSLKDISRDVATGTLSSDILNLLKAQPRVLESTPSYLTVGYSLHPSYEIPSPSSLYSFSKISNTSVPIHSKGEFTFETESANQHSKQFNSCIPYKCHTDTPYSHISQINFDGKIANLPQTCRNIGKIDSIEDIKGERYKGGKGYGLAYAAPRRPISFISPSPLPPKLLLQSTENNVKCRNEVEVKDRSNKSIQDERKNLLAMEIINFISEMKNCKVKSL
jgi:hypothetical protein